MEPNSRSVPFQDAPRRALKPPASGQAEYSDSLTPGLRLRVGKRTKTFVVLRTVDGKRERVTIGQYPAVTLGKAREQVRKLKHSGWRLPRPARIGWTAWRNSSPQKGRRTRRRLSMRRSDF